jgi:hypothetical protein
MLAGFRNRFRKKIRRIMLQLLHVSCTYQPEIGACRMRLQNEGQVGK